MLLLHEFYAKKFLLPDKLSARVGGGAGCWVATAVLGAGRRRRLCWECGAVPKVALGGRVCAQGPLQRAGRCHAASAHWAVSLRCSGDAARSTHLLLGSAGALEPIASFYVLPSRLCRPA